MGASDRKNKRLGLRKKAAKKETRPEPKPASRLTEAKKKVVSDETNLREVAAVAVKQHQQQRRAAATGGPKATKSSKAAWLERLAQRRSATRGEAAKLKSMQEEMELFDSRLQSGALSLDDIEANILDNMPLLVHQEKTPVAK